MADDKDKGKGKGKGKGRRNTPLGPIRVVGPNSPPRTNEGAIDVERVKAMFMASKAVEWAPFAASLGWDPNSSRQRYPTAAWVQEKKLLLAQLQAEEISQLVFEHRGHWHKDVLKTLKDYPEANDVMLGIIQQRMNAIIRTVNSDMEKQKLAAQAGETYEPEFAKVKTSELFQLTLALKTVTESKHRSLLINDWSVKVAETFTDPAQFQKAEEKMQDKEWTVEVIGGENIKSSDLQSFMMKYIDKPISGIKTADTEPHPTPTEGSLGEPQGDEPQQEE